MNLWATLRAHQSSVRALELVPTANYGVSLWSGDDNGWIVWWSLETRRPRAIWQAHTSTVLTVKLMPDNEQLLVTHGRDNKLRIWRLDQNQSYNTSVLTPSSESDDYPKPWLVHTQDVNALNFCSAAVAPNCVAVPATTSSESVDVYQISPFKRLHKAVKPPESEVTPKTGIVMAIVNSQSYLVIAFESGHISTFDNETGSHLATVRAHKQPILSLCLAQNRIWSTGADKNIVSFPVDRPQNFSTTKITGAKGLASIDFCDSINIAATAGWDGLVRLFTVEGSALTEISDFSAGRQSGITVSKVASTDLPDSSTDLVTQRAPRLKKWPPAFLVAAGKDGRIALYGLQLGTLALA